MAAIGLAGLGLAGCEPDPVNENVIINVQYNQDSVAKGSGTAVMDPGSRNGGFIGQYSDSKADGNGAYGQLHTWYWDKALSGGFDGTNVWDVSKNLPTIGTASGVKPAVEVHPVVPTRTGYVQAYMNICAQMGFPVADVCTNGTAKKAW